LKSLLKARKKEEDEFAPDLSSESESSEDEEDKMDIQSLDEMYGHSSPVKKETETPEVPLDPKKTRSPNHQINNSNRKS